MPSFASLLSSFVLALALTSTSNAVPVLSTPDIASLNSREASFSHILDIAARNRAQALTRNDGTLDQGGTGVTNLIARGGPSQVSKHRESWSISRRKRDESDHTFKRQSGFSGSQKK